MRPKKWIKTVWQCLESGVYHVDSTSLGKANRTIKVDEIYTLLEYEQGDTYVVKNVNEQGLDNPVLQFFTELFRDITDRLNRLSETQNDDE